MNLDDDDDKIIAYLDGMVDASQNTDDIAALMSAQERLRGLREELAAYRNGMTDPCSKDTQRIVGWLRSLDAPQYSYGITYEGLARCIASGLDPKVLKDMGADE